MLSPKQVVATTSKHERSPHVLSSCAHSVRTLVKRARKHQHMTIDHLSTLSGITVRRLTRYEGASAPPHWADALRLAQVLDVRMSFIAAALRRPLLALAFDEYKTLVDFVHAQERPERRRLQAGVQRDRVIHFDDGDDEQIHDATIADWPEFLPPLLGDALLAEASRLHTMYLVLNASIEYGGMSVPIDVGRGGQPRETLLLDAGTAMVRVHRYMESVRARLESLRLRHVVSAPQHFAERLEIQRVRIAHAIRLIAPDRREASVGSPEHGRRSACELRNDRSFMLFPEAVEFSVDLPGAMDRVIVASYGLVKMARRCLLP